MKIMGEDDGKLITTASSTLGVDFDHFDFFELINLSENISEIGDPGFRRNSEKLSSLSDYKFAYDSFFEFVQYIVENAPNWGGQDIIKFAENYNQILSSHPEIEYPMIDIQTLTND